MDDRRRLGIRLGKSRVASIGLALLAGVLSNSAVSKNFSYRYLDVGYQRINFSDVDLSANGLAIDGRFPVHPNIHLLGGYQLAQVPGELGDTDNSAAFVGIGGNFEVSQRVDIVMDSAFVRATSNFGILSVRDDGFLIGAGFRAHAMPQLEVDLGLDYVGFGDDGEVTIGGAGIYNFNDVLSVKADVSRSATATAFGLGIRILF